MRDRLDGRSLDECSPPWEEIFENFQSFAAFLVVVEAYQSNLWVHKPSCARIALAHSDFANQGLPVTRELISQRSKINK